MWTRQKTCNEPQQQSTNQTTLDGRLFRNRCASPHGDDGGEPITREQFQGTVQSQLLRMMRRRLATDHEPSLHLFYKEIANSTVSRLPNSSLHLLHQSHYAIRMSESHYPKFR